MAVTKLVTAQEVIDNVFTNNTVDPFIIKDYFIDVAQEEHIRPLIGDDLYDTILAGSLSAANQTLLDDYIKPCLYFYVKYEVITDMALNTTDKGIMVSESDFGSAASGRDRADLIAKAKKMGDTLADKLVRFLNDNSSSYAEWDGMVRNDKGQIKGGVIL